MEEKIRNVIFFLNYFSDFFDELSEKVRDKIDHVLYLITVSERIPSKFFKHIEGTDGLYEIQKTQKTPQSEINKAIQIKTDYFKQKKNEKGRK